MHAHRSKSEELQKAEKATGSLHRWRYLLYTTGKTQEDPTMITKIINNVELVEFDRVHFSEFGDFNFLVVYYMKPTTTRNAWTQSRRSTSPHSKHSSRKT